MLLDFYERHKGAELTTPPKKESGNAYNPISPPPLRHTKVLNAKVAGASVLPPRWNGVLDAALRSSVKQARNPEIVLRKCPLNVSLGKRTDSGFRYLEDIGISVQGQDADDAWKGAASLANAFSIPIEVHFMWRLNRKAAKPGSEGSMILSF